MRIALFALLISSVRAQRCATSDGSPVTPGLYDENYRPQIHFSPSNGFMNDPNGLFFANGLYHMYFQYNPTALVAGNQHWGHATSPDLYTWTNHLPAISPANPDEGIFSGSAVVDYNNTSGFFDNDTAPFDRVVAIYTLNTPEKETQNIAFSSDGGFNFTEFEGNPVIDINSTQFRDPHVIWHAPTSQWIMTVSRTQQYQIVLYGSPDLKTWMELSRFGPAGILGLQYECPSLSEIPIEGTNQTKWVMLINVNPGMPQGGSGMQYFIGDFDGTTFTADDSVTRLSDFAKDNYAGIPFFNVGIPDDQVVFIAWASNWEYSQTVPTTPWRSAQTVPRVLTLANVSYNPFTNGLVLKQTPVDMSTIIGESVLSVTNVTTNGSTSVPGNGTFQFTFDFTGAGGVSSLTLSSTSGSSNITLIVTPNDHFTINRADSGWTSPDFTSTFSQYLVGNDLSVRGIVDRSLLEVYLNDGDYSATVEFFMVDGEVPAALSWEIAEGVTVSQADVTVLNSTWDC